MRLQDVCEGRDNNFNLIRMLAASAVVVSHAWPIALGAGTPEPLSAVFGHSLGKLAVFVFFAISGFLIAQSFDRQPTIRRWLQARVLRIAPGLAVALILSAAVLGPLVTALPVERYFHHPAALSYVPRNLSLALPQYALPGVFAHNPFPYAVNGSLWSLFYEALCYGALLGLGLIGAFDSRWRMAAGLAAFGLAYAVGTHLLPDGALPEQADRLLHLALPFLLGTAFYVWRAWVVLHPGVLLIFAALAALARAGALPEALWYPLLSLSIAYGVLLLGFLPGKLARRYNRLGDYSYGTYIYAFPMQQLAMHALGPMTPVLNIALALPGTLLLAVLSWRWIERPALMLARAPARHHAASKG